MTVIARLLAQAERTPTARAVRFLPDGRTWTYRELVDALEGWASSLHELGVGPGDRVSAVMGRSPEDLILHLALMRLGAVLHPIGTAATAPEIEGLLADIEPSLVVLTAQSEPLVAAAGATPVVHSGRLRGTGAFDGPLPGAGDLACILSTSGTTGMPKGSLTTHANLVANADALIEAWGIGSNDTMLHLLPLHHVHGLFVAVHPFLLTGGTVVLGGRFTPDTVVDHIGGATVLMGVPTFYSRLLDDPRIDRDLLGHMRLFTSGSAPLLASTHRAWEERTGHRILERYGMTEIQMALSNPLDGERRAGTVGAPLPGLEARIRTESGALAADGEPGVLEVRGPTISPGYWRRPDATAASRSEDGWFITGDIVERSRDGYHTIVGRSSDMVISGGFNVYPKEVEDVLDAVPGVVESAVVGVPHSDLGEVVVAVCVGHADDEVVLAAARETLSAYKAPKAIEWVEALPRNSMGKVQKAVLRDHLAARFS